MIGAFVKAPPLAWSGWRLRIPGGPEGGQYHGFVAEDGHDRLSGPPLPPGHPEPYPHPAPWDSVWGGIALREGEDRSDFVYRSSAEIPPRANASGGANVVHAFQTRRTAGYAEAPGNYRGVGILPNRVACPEFTCASPIGWGPAPCHTPICGRPSGHAIVAQPPPPLSPAPSPTVCAPNAYRDAAGYCTSDWHNPYSLYLPQSPAPAPTVAASPADYLPSQGQPLTTAAAAPSWFTESTIIPGVENMWVAGGGLLAAFLFLRGRK